MSDFYNDGNVIETALVKCDKFDDGPYVRLMKCCNCCNHDICKDLREQERQKKIKEYKAKQIEPAIYFDKSHLWYADRERAYLSSNESISQSTLQEALQRWIGYDGTIVASIED